MFPPHKEISLRRSKLLQIIVYSFIYHNIINILCTKNQVPLGHYMHWKERMEPAFCFYNWTRICDLINSYGILSSRQFNSLQTSFSAVPFMLPKIIVVSSMRTFERQLDLCSSASDSFNKTLLVFSISVQLWENSA